MLGRNVQRGEIVPVVLDVRTFGDGEAHLAEDRGQLVDRLADRVDAAVGQRSRRQRDVDPLARESRVEFGFREHGAAGGEQAGDLVLGNIERGATGLALVCWDGAERFHQLGDAPLLAKPLDAQGFESGTVSGGLYTASGVGDQGGDVVRHVVSRFLGDVWTGRRETKKARLAGQALPFVRPFPRVSRGRPWPG